MINFHFPRPGLADDLAKRLVEPGALDAGLRSGLFISGLRRTGKTTFLRTDLIPALERRGATVVYVDLWVDVRTSPAVLIHEAVKSTLADAAGPALRTLLGLRKVKKAGVEAAGVKFGVEIDTIGAPGGTTLARAFTELVDKTRRPVVLIVDEVQQALSSEDGRQAMLALKAARDAINPRPKTPGLFYFIGTGSHRALVGELAARRNQAFAGAVSVDFPLLGDDYVAFVLDSLAREGMRRLPKAALASEVFGVLGHRPEDLVKALRLTMAQVAQGADAGVVLPAVAHTLRAEAANFELMKVDEMGHLAVEVFDRIASADGTAKGLFSAPALRAYGQAIGRDLGADDVQRVLEALVEANLVMRRGHGLYDLADPYVRTVVLERKALLGRR